MYRFCNFSWESLISISLRQGWIELSADDSAETMDSPLSGVIRVSSDRPLSLFIYIFNANIPYIFFVYENDLFFLSRYDYQNGITPTISRSFPFSSWISSAFFSIVVSRNCVNKSTEMSLPSSSFSSSSSSSSISSFSSSSRNSHSFP